MKGAKSRSISDILGRKTIIILLIILIIGLAITTIVLMGGAKEETKEESIVYKESSIVDYNVYLKENEFFKNEYLEKDNQYIASLINYVNANLKYNLTSSAKNITHRYKYKIIAETKVEDKSTGNTIYKFSENLLEEKIAEFNTNKKLTINEQLKIDYNKYNSIIKKFISTYNLDEIESTLVIKMYVNVEGVSKSSAPVSSLIIPLTTKTVAIDISSSSVNATEISVYKEIANKNNLYISILTFILTIMVGIELYIFTRGTKDPEAIYKTKVKKLLLNYDSYIQKISNDFNYDGYQELKMKSFEDLLQIRDTISQPILMLENDKKKETEFFIPGKGKVVYSYKITLEEVKKEEKDKQNSKKK